MVEENMETRHGCRRDGWLREGWSHRYIHGEGTKAEENG